MKREDVKNKIPGITDYLPLSGGTITGGLIVQDGISGSLRGDVTGNLTGNVQGDVNGSATKWNGRTLRLNNNTSDTYLLLLSGSNVDYITKDQLLSSLTQRVAECEQTVKAIGQTTEVLVKTAVSAAYNYDSIYNKTFTLATASSEIAFVTIGGSRLLRGSNKSIQISSANNSAGGYTSYLYGIFAFNSNGSITVTRDAANSYQDSYAFSGFKWSHNINYYKYAV